MGLYCSPALGTLAYLLSVSTGWPAGLPQNSQSIVSASKHLPMGPWGHGATGMLGQLDEDTDPQCYCLLICTNLISTPESPGYSLMKPWTNRAYRQTQRPGWLCQSLAVGPP